ALLRRATSCFGCSIKLFVFPTAALDEDLGLEVDVGAALNMVALWSPYFLGAKRAAAHLRVSTRKRATLQFSCVAVSAISIHSLKNLSACASRARISQESPRRSSARCRS